MVQFGSNREDAAFGSRHRPPPNYFSRRVQIKILMLVFLFFGILFLMSEARNPKNWEWMWQLNADRSQIPLATDDEPRELPVTANGTLDTRPPRRPQDPASSQPVVTARGDQAKVPNGIEGAADAGTTADMDGWNRVLRRLSKDERQLFQKGLWSWRNQHPLSDQERAAWSKLLRRLDENWSDYHTRALLSIAQEGEQLTDRQKRESVAIIESSRRRWDARKKALAAIGGGEKLTTSDERVLDELQQVLDRRAWEQVEDNSVLLSAETEAWYRCWEQLQSLSDAQRASALGPLNFVQLFSQSTELRGRLVKVQGTARWGYLVKSRNPRFGVDSYYVLGLLPHDGSGSPIVIYCRQLPPGFPDIVAGTASGKGTLLDEDVEVIGYYFKRWLHRSEGGMNLSPLILGELTNWRPTPRVGEDDTKMSVSGTALFFAVLAMALGASLIALLVYRSSRWSSTEASRSTQPPRSLPTFDTEDVQGSVAETLRKYSEQEQNPS